jgi:AcrR family transcriptional regulator
VPKTGLDSATLQSRALDTAEKLICQLGPDRLRLTDIARALGISHAALYKHFTDKEAVMDAVSKRWLDGIDSELARVTARNKSAESRLIDWFTALHRLKRKKILNDPELYSAFDMATQKMRPFVQIHLKTALAQLTSIVEEGMHNGELKGHANDVAMILFEGTAAFHHPRLVKETIQLDRLPALRRLLKTLITGLRP